MFTSTLKGRAHTNQHKSILTVGDVRRSKAVIHEDTVGFCHFQVDHVGGVFQGSHGVFVAHLFKASTVHLHRDRPESSTLGWYTHTHTHTHIYEQHTQGIISSD